MTLTEALSNIGLNNYEAEVYLALLRLGRTTAGPILRTTQFHRQVVYTALDRLAERGFVSFVIHNNRKQFSAANPDDLLRREMERYREFTAVIPQLKTLQKKANSQLHVETFVGSNELVQSLLSAVDSAARTDGTIRIIGGDRGSELYGFMGSRYAEYVQYAYTKGVRKHLIATPASVEQYRDRFLQEKRAKLRLHEMGFSTPTYSLITQELMDLCIISDEVLILRVWNKTIAKTYIDQFELLWKVGTPFPPPRRTVTVGKNKVPIAKKKKG